MSGHLITAPLCAEFPDPSSSWYSPRIAGNWTSNMEKKTLSKENGKHFHQGNIFWEHADWLFGAEVSGEREGLNLENIQHPLPAFPPSISANFKVKENLSRVRSGVGDIALRVAAREEGKERLRAVNGAPFVVFPSLSPKQRLPVQDLGWVWAECPISQGLWLDSDPGNPSLKCLSLLSVIIMTAST